jgi:glutamyl-tRNA synthetase
MEKTTVRTRFAPSPTGYLHVGSLRTAMYGYAFAKGMGGKFILRVEDTDRNRYVEGATENLIKMLKYFGIHWDEGPEVNGPYKPYIQSERVKTGIYEKYANQLLEQGNAYYCFCPPKSKNEIKSEHAEKKVELRDPCRNLTKEEASAKIKSGLTPAIRLRVPDEGSISFKDFILKKEISWQLKDVDEVMLLKSDKYPTYHLGVVVDDAAMKISHITRAHEWLPSTPVHLLLFKYLGFPTPEIGHLTDILDPTGGKLSKRKGNVAAEQFLEAGYLKEAILNYVMLVGWAPKDNREIFTLEEFVKEFHKGNIQTTNAVFDTNKLDWFNGEYIRQKSDEELTKLLMPFVPGEIQESDIKSITPLIKSRIKKLSDFTDLAGFFFSEPKVDISILGENYKEHLTSAKAVIEGITSWNKEELDKQLLQLIADKNYHTGKFFMDLRIALTGNKATPPINDSIIILGKDRTLKRLENVLI